MLEYIQKIFTPETVTVILGLIASAISVIKMAITLKQQAKVSVKNAQEIASSVLVASKDAAEKIVVDEIKPFLEELKIVKGSLQTFSKVFLLMQENSSQSKLAIMDLIEQLGQVDVKEVEDIRDNIVKAIQVEEKKEEIKQEKLTKISEGRF